MVTSSAPPLLVRCVSVSASGQTTPGVHGPALSADGSFVSYTADNDKGSRDVVLVDVNRQETASRARGEWEAGRHTNRVCLSAGADKIAYACKDAGGGEAMRQDVRVSPASGNGEVHVPAPTDTPAGEEVAASQPAMSADGRWLAFTESVGPAGGFWSNQSHVYRYDTVTGDLRRVNHDTRDLRFHRSETASISDDGRYVAFEAHAYGSEKKPWLPGGRGQPEIFVHDFDSGSTRCISLADRGTPADNSSFFPVISGNGRYVVFGSRSTDMVKGATPSPGPPYTLHFYLHDNANGTTRLVGEGARTHMRASDEMYQRAAISADGRYVAIAGDRAGTEHTQIQVYDVEQGKSAPVSVTGIGGWANADCFEPTISADGSTIAFTSKASNMGLEVEVDAGSLFKQPPPARDESQAFIAANPLLSNLPGWASHNWKTPPLPPPKPPGRIENGDEVVVIGGIRVPKRHYLHINRHHKTLRPA